MGEGILYLMTSFWLGAVHAATPGHGKTIAAAYIVGVRGRPVDALVLGIFVTLSHTSGIVLVAVLATAGSTWLIPQRIEAYLAVGTGILVIGIGCWMLRTQMRLLAAARTQSHRKDRGMSPRMLERPGITRTLIRTRTGRTTTATDGVWFTRMTSRRSRKSGRSSRSCSPLGIAGGLLPDPGALAILLAAIAKGKLILGLADRSRLQPGVCIRPRRRGRGRGAPGTAHPCLAKRPLDRLDSDRGGAADPRGRRCPDRKRLAHLGRGELMRAGRPYGAFALRLAGIIPAIR